MSRIKDLKTNPDHNINVIDIFSLITPGKKTKYVEMILRMMKNTPSMVEYNSQLIHQLNTTLNVDKDELDKIPTFHLAFYYRFLDSMFNMGDLKDYQKFCEFNERGLIEQNDLTKYTSFEDMSAQVSLAEMKADMKEMESQIIKIYETEEWLVLRPLTYKSSLKYGANTKWCTASQHNYDYFKKYSHNGILLYMINKKTGLKVACYKELTPNGEFSFWNQKDTRIDSMQSELPIDVILSIKNEVETNQRSNSSFLTKEQIKKEDSMNSDKHLKEMSTDEPYPYIRPGVTLTENTAMRDVLGHENEAMDESPDIGLSEAGVEVEVGSWNTVAMESLQPEIRDINNRLSRG